MPDFNFIFMLSFHFFVHVVNFSLPLSVYKKNVSHVFLLELDKE